MKTRKNKIMMSCEKMKRGNKKQKLEKDGKNTATNPKRERPYEESIEIEDSKL